jgi:hypothetical protein
MLNTTILAHCDAVSGGRQPSHLLPAQVRLDIGRWDQANVVARCHQRPCPVVGCSASFHSDQARRQLLEELMQLPAAQRLAQYNLSMRVDAMQLVG